ncbi:MAG: FkbM family methyltransferase [Ignavibacteriales bacterium]|nr:MAG: FkbM family methyltransferase [Ignavibacteriales bacterium]
MKLFFKILFKGSYYFFKNKNQREFMRLVFLYGDKKRYESRKIKFLDYKITVPDCLSFVWQFKEIFADENYKFNSHSSSPIIYDCGANIGLSCIYFKKLFPSSKIKAFEAEPAIAEILKNNLKDNRITDVQVITAAVWNDDKGVDFSSEGADGSSMFADGKKSRVNSIRLKDYIEKEERIDLLKLDIEGAETEVIRDCRNNLGNVQHLFVEYHSYVENRQTLDELLKIITDAGFRYFIKPEQDRKYPFINRINKNFPHMDLQLNIFAYR